MEIDLVLAGSGVRFGAYFGGIKALEEMGYEVKRIIGSSGGAIAGGLYASGVSIDALINEYMRLDFKKFRKFRPFSKQIFTGIFSNCYVAERIDQITGGMQLKHAKIEFHATATDERRDVQIWNKDTAPDMSIGQAARMSAAFPFYYQRVRYGDSAYTDGGWMKNYAIDYFDEKERPVVGMRVTGNKKIRNLAWTPIGMGFNLFKAKLHQTEREDIHEAYWARTIQINTGDIPMMDFSLSKEDRETLIKSGYDYVKRYGGKL